MSRHRLLICLVLLGAVLAWTTDHGVRAASEKAAADAKATATAKATTTAKTTSAQAKMPQGQGKMPKMRQTTQAQRKAAAAASKKKGLVVGGTVAAAALIPAPGGTPDYFGPYSNWANSPLPSGAISAITIVSPGTLYTAPTVTITDVYAAAPVPTTATVVAGAITAIAIPAGTFTAPVVNITDTTGTGAVATATITPTAGTGLRKFMDAVPNLVIATPDIVSYPGTDYYEIELNEFNTWQFHSDLGGPTRLRGYRQTNNGTNAYSATNTGGCGAVPPAAHVCTAADNTVAPPAGFSYLGPTIVATEGRPTRIKFTNNLPTTAAGGNLFIPTDTTIMGAGSGWDPVTSSLGTYPQNRGTLHLHGGFTPWISDGTPHQWVTPPGEGGVLTKGVSTQSVPDMALPAGSSMTFYWPNQQSGRLMFYHDHAYGITRLNVYAGEAAGYLLVDPVERALNTTAGIATEIPLVIQDRTFVWGSQTTGTGTWATDPTWNWGSTPGSLWFPHVYMTNQNPWNVTGANAMGRWDYALWFWPPFTGLLAHGTVPNPYASNGPWEPPEIPGTPNPSLVPEAFMDTPVVNGKAYPTLQVPAGPVRFRILNAANDRFWNLSLFVAADKTSPTTAATNTPLTRAVPCTGSVAVTNCTEVAMVPASAGTLCAGSVPCAFPQSWVTPTDGGAVKSDILDARTGGVPDPTYLGPNWIQIGTEGGLLPAPAVIPPSPIGYQYNPRNIVIGNVTKHSLFLGPAERADVIVDFSAFAGQTLILYNDSPAPVPALDSRIDYYTGDLDQTDTGGAPPTLPGYGPNTRTVMQIQVGPTVTGTLNLGALQAAFATTANTTGAFAASQDPILVAQANYNSAYNGSFPSAVGVNPSAYARIQDTSLSFNTIQGTNLPSFPLQPKAIQELFELDYGRMNATLGVELPFTNGGNQTTLPMGYTEPATEIIATSLGISVPVLGDGTQLWKITHNGVDTHAIHVHLFNAQVINRVGWDGAIRPPEPNELGWKETIRMNPLEDIIIALRPTTPQLPFGLPNSVRLMSPAEAPGTLINTFDTTTGNPITVANAPYNFGWEYVWHCHLLGHEENDMMRPTVFNVPSVLPAAPNPVALIRNGGSVTLSWVDGTPFNYATFSPAATLGNAANEIGFLIQRAPVGNNGKPGAYVQIGTAPANTTTFVDLTAGTSSWSYIVAAYNAAGNSPSTAVSSVAPPAAPSNVVGTLQAGPQIRVTWTDNSNNETGFVLQRMASNVGTWAALANVGANITAYTDATVAPGITYTYRVAAVNAGGSSAFVTSPQVGVPLAPAAPSNVLATRGTSGGGNNNRTVTLTWTNNSVTQTGLTIQRATTANGPWTSYTVGATAVTWTQTGLPRNTNYYYRIQSFNLGGASAFVNATNGFPINTQ